MSCFKFCVGDFDKLVQAQEPTRNDDGAGGFDSTIWGDKFQIWCMVEEKSGNEKFNQMELDTVKNVHFTTHYRADLLVTDRLVLDGVNYNIRRVDDLKRQKKYMLIVCDGGVVD